ncbi:bifunctional phosphoribosyl-AMP cyclohydrolase/phosphoribosyl-ATP diphosphatase HisIE [Chamaesiphon polymorphus]|jgi:phosphoribosyl-AMP cyclohydrolase / phosphoribosyl-ATP pyrophosphohydrolase|uniref:Histidine biosynthesis bifunctional protein HisIE n=1 Tax=Chamaesiphon polymorphus CCALA 037 TaxID=2107692 RepID=A0A2T1FZ30_9CYAN|nr:bifunctional phosphoribosyl-AMP cyclohydrolase/phosphoribosyl-ATP diphosphatase HisIE [Chamaesiphon polymorphus]PSB50211.1 bifunctional phosphoribosyl-AMP cyclohydrolase/phosphoribosyl-ATP diphosphatase [Chamaesiphon polymorphus CCALA 037]
MSVDESVSLRRAIPIDRIKYDDRGLVPAIIQDYLDGTVLMMAWMNSESLAKTLDTGETWFWSRSRQEFWHKGATSGHIQHVKDIRYDCDSDALLISVEQVGDIACHTGERSCFHQIDTAKVAPPADTLSDLYQTICDRRDNPREGSYTQSLFAGGDNKILKKIGEEAVEVVMACKDDRAPEIAGEAADLFYHTLVALAHHRVSIRDVYRELQNRRK